MWLRDSLPDDLPGARIIIYGYDSPIHDGQSFQNIADLATKLRDGLCTIRRGQRDRPLLFIAHSLGGIIVKQVSPRQLAMHGTLKNSPYLRLCYLWP